MKSSSLPSILMRKRCSKLSEPRVYAPLFEKHDVFHPDKNCNAGKVLKAFRTESTRSLRQKPCRLSVLHIFLEISKVLKFPMNAAGAGCSFFNRKWATLGAESLVFRRAHVRQAIGCETAALRTVGDMLQTNFEDTNFLGISKVLKFPMNAAGAGCSFFNQKRGALSAESSVFRRAHVREAIRCETAALCTI